MRKEHSSGLDTISTEVSNGGSKNGKGMHDPASRRRALTRNTGSKSMSVERLLRVSVRKSTWQVADVEQGSLVSAMGRHQSPSRERPGSIGKDEAYIMNREPREARFGAQKERTT